jgi:hypothetical protein
MHTSNSHTSAGHDEREHRFVGLDLGQHHRQTRPSPHGVLCLLSDEWKPIHELECAAFCNCALSARCRMHGMDGAGVFVGGRTRRTPLSLFLCRPRPQLTLWGRTETMLHSGDTLLAGPVFCCMLLTLGFFSSLFVVFYLSELLLVADHVAWPPGLCLPARPPSYAYSLVLYPAVAWSTR